MSFAETIGFIRLFAPLFRLIGTVRSACATGVMVAVALWLKAPAAKSNFSEVAPPNATVVEVGVPGVIVTVDPLVGVALAGVEAVDSPPPFTAVTIK